MKQKTEGFVFSNNANDRHELEKKVKELDVTIASKELKLSKTKDFNEMMRLNADVNVLIIKKKITEQKLVRLGDENFSHKYPAVRIYAMPKRVVNY